MPRISAYRLIVLLAVFVFNAVSESPNVVGGMDVITDFTRGADRLDFSLIDPFAALVGDQAFRLAVVGGGTGVISVTQLGGNNFVSAYTNGDALADAVVQLNGLHNLTAADFIL